MDDTQAVIRSSILTILPAIKAKLIAGGILSDQRILWVARRRDVPFFTGDQDLLLCPRGFRSDGSTVSGAGRNATELHRVLDLYIRQRMALDQVDSDEQWMLSNAGYFALEEAIVSVLQMADLVDSAGNALLVEPIAVIDGSDPAKNEGRDDDPIWGQAVLSFSIVYDLKLTISETNQ